MTRLADKTAVITGAARGLGEAVAVLFAQEGARVVVADVDYPSVEATADKIASGGGEVAAVQADITLAGDAEYLMNTAVERFGSLAVLVNNAGIASAGGVTQVGEDEWDRVMAVNVKGAYLCSRHAVPYMEKAGGGSIVCVSSASGVIGQKAQVAYNVSKHAVLGLVRCMALDHADARIRVNAVCPGVMNTSMLDPLSDEQRAGLGGMHALGRIAEVSEIAQTVLHLAADESSFTTGAIFLVDGGLTAR